MLAECFSHIYANVSKLPLIFMGMLSQKAWLTKQRIVDSFTCNSLLPKNIPGSLRHMYKMFHNLELEVEN